VSKLCLCLCLCYLEVREEGKKRREEEGKKRREEEGKKGREEGKKGRREEREEKKKGRRKEGDCERIFSFYCPPNVCFRSRGISIQYCEWTSGVILEGNIKVCGCSFMYK
jgi:hypothetical protein